MYTTSPSRFYHHDTVYCLYLTEQQVSDVENHAEGELGCEQGEEPLGGIHVCLQVQLLEVGPQVWKLFLFEQEKQQEVWILIKSCH